MRQGCDKKQEEEKQPYVTALLSQPSLNWPTTPRMSPRPLLHTNTYRHPHTQFIFNVELKLQIGPVPKDLLSLNTYKTSEYTLRVTDRERFSIFNSCCFLFIIFSVSFIIRYIYLSYD